MGCKAEKSRALMSTKRKKPEKLIWALRLKFKEN